MGENGHYLQAYPSSSTSNFLTPAGFPDLEDPSSRRSSQVSSSSAAGQGKGKRRYQCALPGCDKAFNSAGHLARHNRTHTGEKAFPCTWEGCTSRFSRHDNMLQHYRGHINKSQRRRKPASTSASAALAASTSSSKGKARSSPASRSGAAAGEPVFIHSSYSSLASAVQPPKRSASLQYPSGASNSTVYDSSSSISRHHSTSPPSSTSSLRAYTTTTTTTLPQEQQRFLDLSSLPPSMQNGPPLASPSFMERPHTANEGHQDFFTVQQPQPSRPVGGLVHRHSYHNLPALVTEPVTPLEDYENPWLNSGSPALSSSSFSSSATSFPYDRRPSYGLPGNIPTAPHSAGSIISPASTTHGALQHQQLRSYRQLQYVQQLPPVPSARHASNHSVPQRLFQSPGPIHTVPRAQQHSEQQHFQYHQQQQPQYQNVQQYSMGFDYSAIPSPTIGSGYASDAFSTYSTHDPPPPLSSTRASGLPSLQLPVPEPSVLQHPEVDEDVTPTNHPATASTSTMEQYIDPLYSMSPSMESLEPPSAGYVWPSKPLFPGADGQDMANQEPLPTSPSWYRGPPQE